METLNETPIGIVPFLCVNTPTKEGLIPIKIRLTYKGERKYIPVIHNNKPLHLSPEEGKFILETDIKMMKGKRREIKKTINDKVNSIETAVKSIQGEFAFDKISSVKNLKGFLDLFKSHIEQFKTSGKLGTYRSYSASYSAFNRFRGGDKEKTGKELKPSNLTPTILHDFEQYLKDSQCNKTTIGIYMRVIRLVFNVACLKNPRLISPFARNKNDTERYRIKKGSGHKSIALTANQLEAFRSIPLPKDKENLFYEAKMMFLFLFYCQGMNVKDMCKLKYENIDSNAIRYIRSKTEDTETEEIPIEIPMNNEIGKIILEFGNSDKSMSSFVFKYMKVGLTPHEQENVIQYTGKKLNKYLKFISEDNDLPVFTTYASRHTYASLMKFSGVPIELIREVLGHKDLKTTENYLRQFDLKKIKKANEKMARSIMRSS